MRAGEWGVADSSVPIGESTGSPAVFLPAALSARNAAVRTVFADLRLGAVGPSSGGWKNRHDVLLSVWPLSIWEVLETRDDLSLGVRFSENREIEVAEMDRPIERGQTRKCIH